VGIDLTKTELVSEDDFKTDEPEDDGGSSYGGWGRRYGD
jgi:hypothetical protein